MTRISKRVREEAAQICSMAASNPEADCSIWELSRFQYGDLDAALVAAKAANHAALSMTSCYGMKLWAEAECLLRTGWTPGGGS